ncbi:hypothetical protein FACS1894181_17110 [Bacteroidia bacterium]|nr:hypothetical protein FACS1894181_17110 [Bacteroidia bacterium]
MVELKSIINIISIISIITLLTLSLSTGLISCKRTPDDLSEKAIAVAHEQTGKAETEVFNEIPVYAKCMDYDNNLSSIASGIEFIPIDAEPPIRDFHVYDVSAGRNCLFLSDIYQIIQYDRHGKYIKHIGSRGMGPAEFVQLGIAPQIDYERELIYALDVERRRILTYRFDGSFAEAVSLYSHASYIDMIDSTRIACRQIWTDRYKPSCELIRFIDYNGKLAKTYNSHRYPVAREDMENFGPESFLWKHEGNNYYLEYGSDTIFQIRKDTIVPLWKLTGELKPDLMEHFQKNTGKKLTITGYVMRPNAAIFESGRFIIFKISANHETYYKTFDKQARRFQRTYYKDAQENRSGVRKMDFFIDDLISGLPFNPQYQNEGKAFALIPSEEICEQKTSILAFINSHPSNEGAKLKQIVENMTEDDNALLMIATFK